MQSNLQMHNYQLMINKKEFQKKKKKKKLPIKVPSWHRLCRVIASDCATVDEMLLDTDH